MSVRPAGDFKTSYVQDMALLETRFYRLGFTVLVAGLLLAPWRVGRLHDRPAHRHWRVDRAYGPAVLLHPAGRLAGRRCVRRQPGPQPHRASVHGRAGS